MTTVDSLVADYLARLEQVASTLPPDRRAELLEGISDHIDAARAAGDADDEAAVRTVLDRLGAPAEIVAAAREDAPPYAPPLVARRRGTGLELAAVLMLTVGSLLPLIGWLVGVGLLWASPRWRVVEKLVGTLVVPLGPGAALYAGALVPFGTSEVCTGAVDGSVTCISDGPPGWIYAVLLAVLLVAPVVVAVWLFRTASRRAGQEPPELVPTYGPATGS